MIDFSLKIEEKLATLDHELISDNLDDTLRYMLSLGGKRLRPTLVLFGYGLKKNDFDQVLEPALAVELFHNFTLVHDDLMDDSTIRRGKSTVHNKWDVSTAILCGDVLMVKAFQWMLKSKKTTQQVLEKFCHCAVQVCDGQQMDIDFASLETVNEQQYLQMIHLKTAVLLGFCLEYGGILADVGERVAIQLRQIGETAGMGFQLMDDYLDTYGDETKFGKQIGGDITSNKKTFLLVKSLEIAQSNQKKELHSWISHPCPDISSKIQAVKGIYDELNIEKRVLDKLNMYYDKCFSLIEKIPYDLSRKQNLSEYINRLMKREK